MAYLKKFDGDDAFLSPNIEAMIGNCYANMDQYDDAIKAFEKAAKKADNEMASPIFLQKAATVAEKIRKLWIFIRRSKMNTHNL